MQLKGIFFDLGDTLVDEETFWPLDGAEEVLEKLKGRYKLAVISNTTTSTTEDIKWIMERSGLLHFFDCVIASKSFGARKPDVSIFNFVLETLSLKPEEVVFVGNKISTDILGANKTGMESILLRWNSRYLEEPSSPEEEPDFVINSFKELLKIVENLNQTPSEGGL